MAWNLLWHQAIIHSPLLGTMVKRGKTVAFEVPVRCDGSAVRLVMENGRKNPARVKIALWYEGEVYPVTQADDPNLVASAESLTMTERIQIPLKQGTRLEVRVFCQDYYPDGNMIEEGAIVYKGNALDLLNPVPARMKETERSLGVYPVIPLIRRIDIESQQPQETIVAFGDSITAMSRWTKPLSERMYEAYGPEVVLANSGISGSCMGREAGKLWFGFFGERGTKRYERDVLKVPNVKTVIMAFGINDISDMTEQNRDKWNLSLLIRETKNMIGIFHMEGIRVVGWTLGPRKHYGKWTKEQEEIRQAYNAWIRSEDSFDYVVDPEPLLLEEGTTDVYKKGLHQGDFLHPSKEGGKIIADCFDLEKLR